MVLVLVFVSFVSDLALLGFAIKEKHGNVWFRLLVMRGLYFQWVVLSPWKVRIVIFLRDFNLVSRRSFFVGEKKSFRDG